MDGLLARVPHFNEGVRVKFVIIFMYTVNVGPSRCCRLGHTLLCLFNMYLLLFYKPTKVFYDTFKFKVSFKF